MKWYERIFGCFHDWEYTSESELIQTKRCKKCGKALLENKLF